MDDKKSKNDKNTNVEFADEMNNDSKNKNKNK